MCIHFWQRVISGFDVHPTSPSDPTILQLSPKGSGIIAYERNQVRWVAPRRGAAIKIQGPGGQEKILCCACDHSASLDINPWPPERDRRSACLRRMFNAEVGRRGRRDCKSTTSRQECFLNYSCKRTYLQWLYRVRLLVKAVVLFSGHSTEVKSSP